MRLKACFFSGDWTTGTPARSPTMPRDSTAARPDLDHPGHGQLLEGLADRGSRDMEPVGQRNLVAALAGHEMAGRDVVLDRLTEALGGAEGACIITHHSCIQESVERMQAA